jgi:hypothetical protein
MRILQSIRKIDWRAIRRYEGLNRRARRVRLLLLDPVQVLLAVQVQLVAQDGPIAHMQT